MKIQNTKDVKSGPVKACVYGQSGAGKTTLAKSLPHEETLVISSEAGLLSLAETDIDYIDLSVNDEGKILDSDARYKKLGEVYKYLQSEDAQKKYKNIFIDSMTEIAEFIVEGFRKKYEGEKNGFLLWGEYSQEMTRILKAFRDLPKYNVFMVFLEDADKDETGRRYYGPDIPGKSAKAFIVPSLDIVMRLVVADEGKRVLVSQPTTHSIAKDRSGKLGPTTEPDLSKVIHAVRSI